MTVCSSLIATPGMIKSVLLGLHQGLEEVVQGSGDIGQFIHHAGLLCDVKSPVQVLGAAVRGC